MHIIQDDCWFYLPGKIFKQNQERISWKTDFLRREKSFLYLHSHKNLKPKFSKTKIVSCDYWKAKKFLRLSNSDLFFFSQSFTILCLLWRLFQSKCLTFFVRHGNYFYWSVKNPQFSLCPFQEKLDCSLEIKAFRTFYSYIFYLNLLLG